MSLFKALDNTRELIMGDWIEVRLAYQNLINILINEGYHIGHYEPSDIIDQSERILREWCREIASRDFYNQWIPGNGGYMMFRFRRRSHATLFKLKWAGV